MSAQPNVRAELAAEFTNGEVRQFTKDWTGKDGRSHSMTFDYIEDETVMDRLDDVFGVGMWSLTVEPISVADGIVKVRLAVGDAVYEDFGYSSNAQGEQLKEAVSDGIRRCGRFLGIGRYLYKKHAPIQQGRQPVQNAPQRPAPARPPLRSVSAPDDPYGDDLGNVDAIASGVGPNDLSRCAIHGTPWKGEPGDQYHKKPEGGYCRSPLNDPKPARAR